MRNVYVPSLQISRKRRPRKGIMDKIRLGQITGAAGIKGEVKVYPYADEKEVFSEISYVLIGDERFNVKGARYQKNIAILTLEGIGDRTSAERYRGRDLHIERADAPPLPEDTYYVKDLVGLRVVEESGDGSLKEIGALSDVIKNSAQDLYEVSPLDGGRPFLIPAVEEFVKEIDLEAGRIRVRLIEGLREL